MKTVTTTITLELSNEELRDLRAVILLNSNKIVLMYITALLYYSNQTFKSVDNFDIAGNQLNVYVTIEYFN